MASRTRVFIACSLDGFIAGPGGDLSFLPPPPADGAEDFGWGAFIATVGCLLVGRATYDAVAAMGIAWPHAERHTLVATHRPLATALPTVTPVAGDIRELVGRARELACDRDVYLDGGTLIRQALDAGLVDTLTVTLCPVILGQGHPLFAGVSRRHGLGAGGVRALPGGLVQLEYTVASG